MSTDASLPDGTPPLPEIRDDDPDVQDEVTRALGRYEKLVPADVFQAMQENLIDALTTHPVGMRLIEKKRQERKALRSGERKKGNPSGELTDETGETGEKKGHSP